MPKVIFRNKGIIDIRSIKTFGISVKVGDNPIGFFGTGLKYAIAILIREQQEIEIFAGKQRFLFEKKVVDVRGKLFEMITMNGEELPFTTELGKTWEMWQAFREIYCNCLDEKGVAYLGEEVEPTDDETYIVVRGQKFLNWFMDKDNIVLNLPSNLCAYRGQVEIYRSESRFVFYRGVRVYKIDSPALYTYNLIDSCDLTEDRTLKFLAYDLLKIPAAVAKLTDKTIIRNILLAPMGTFEQSLNFGNISFHDHEVSQEFLEVLEGEYNRNNDGLNASARQYIIKKQSKAAYKNLESEPLTDVEQMQFDRAMMVARKVYGDIDEFPIIVVKNLGQTTMAFADEEQKRIVISKPSFKFGTKYLTSTIIEEYVHLRTGYKDHTRELQTYLFDQICSMVEDHVIKEPI